MRIQSIASEFGRDLSPTLNLISSPYQLLEGKAHCYVFASAGCKKWDTCAPEAILEADGGVLTDILGKHYAYGPGVAYANKTGVLATARATNHQDLLEKIPDHVKNKLNA